MRSVLARLGEVFGLPEWRNPLPPVDELVCTILSQNTNDRNRDIAITALKKQKLVLVAQHYIQNIEPSAQQWRIDVVAIELDRQNRPRRIEIFENAVGLDEPQ